MLQMGNPNSKKRAVMTHELAGKFSAKKDFMKYFSEQCKCLSLNDLLLSSATLPAS